jgi:hypothetical protein
MSYTWQGGPNQGQIHRSTFMGGHLGTPHQVPGSMLPSHNGPHHKTGRHLGEGSSTRNGFSEGSAPQNTRVPGYPNVATARHNALHYTPPA